MILGLDTATAATVVAVWAPGGPEAERRDDPPAGARPGHASRLLPLVEEALAAAGATWDDIERIACGTGPGGFTGLRLGIATARALAQARDLPLVGVSTLAALREGVRPLESDTLRQSESPPAEGSDPYPAAALKGSDPSRVVADPSRVVADPSRVVAAVIDARRGEVFAAVWRGEEPLLEAQAIGPENLAAQLPEGTLAVGDGAVRFRAELERAGASVPADDSPAHRVSALVVCRLGAAGTPADRDALLPDYRREPDAKPPRLP